MSESKQIFIKNIKESLDNNHFLSIKISKPSNKQSDYKNIFIKKIELNNTEVLNFVFNNKRQDITKNYDFNIWTEEINMLLWEDFKNAVLFTQNNDIFSRSNC